MFEVIMKNENRNDLISLKGIFKLDLLYLFVSCLYGHHMTDWYPWSSDEESPGTGIKSDYKPVRG